MATDEICVFTGMTPHPPRRTHAEWSRPQGDAGHFNLHLRCRHLVTVAPTNRILQEWSTASSRLPCRFDKSTRVPIPGIILVIIIFLQAPVVTTNLIHVSLVKDSSQKILVNSACSAEGVSYNVNLRAPPFDNQEIEVNQISGRAHIYDRSKWRQIDHNVIIALAQSLEQPLGCNGSQNLA